MDAPTRLDKPKRRCQPCNAALCHGTSRMHSSVQQCGLISVLCGIQANPRFAELTENIATVVRVFNQRVEASKQAGGWDWSVERVLEVIVCECPSSCATSHTHSTLSAQCQDPGGELMRMFQPGRMLCNDLLERQAFQAMHAMSCPLRIMRATTSSSYAVYVMLQVVVRSIYGRLGLADHQTLKPLHSR